VSYVEAVPISVRSIVNKTEDHCRGMSGVSDKVSVYGSDSDTQNIYAMSKQSADSASVTLTGGAAGDTNGLTTAPYTGTPNGSGSGSGSSSACCDDMATLDTLVVNLTGILTGLNGRGDVDTAKKRFDLMTQKIEVFLSNIP